MSRNPLKRNLYLSLLGMCLLLLVDSGVWAGTVSGRVMYMDKIYDFSPFGAGYVGTTPVPARYVDLELRRSDNPGVILGSGATDGEGYYSFNVASVGEIEVDLYVIGTSQTSPWITVHVMESRSASRVQTISAGPFLRNTSAHEVIDYTVPTHRNGVRLGQIVNILDCILTAAELVYPALGTRLPDFTVHWEDGSTNGTYFLPGQNKIYLLGGTRGAPNSGDDDGYDDPVIIHEFGHFLADRYSYDRSPGGDHSLIGYYSPTLTWSEGWAHVFQAFARRSALYWDSLSGDTGGFNLDFEEGKYNQVVRSEFVGMNNEVAVACSVYDLHDDETFYDSTPGVDDDPYAYDFDLIWEVLTREFTASSLATMDDFYQGWKYRFPQLPTQAAFVPFGMEFVPHDFSESVKSRPRVAITIPDADADGLVDVLTVPDSSGGKILSDGVQVWAAIRHGRRGDLALRLIHPDGTSAQLKWGGLYNPDADVMEWYGYANYEIPVESLSVFTGKPSAGDWKLEVVDSRVFYAGYLDGWRLKLKTEQSGTWQVY